MKKCRGLCKRSLPYTNFYKNKSEKDGIDSRCKQCSREYDKTRKEYHYKKYREWVIQHPGYITIKYKEWLERNNSTT